MGIYGQDWASFQSPAPSTTGLSFVFVKATEGLTYTNPRYAAQVAHARLYKLVVGHYHYPHMANDPVAEANRFLAVADVQPGDLLCLDWEGYDVANRAVPMSRQIAYKNAFLSRLHAAMPTHQGGTYANASYLAADPKGPYGDFFWIATADKPAGQPGISRTWLFHQYGASGVDKDYCPMTADALRAWARAKEDDVPLTPADATTVWAFKNTKAGDTTDMHQKLVNVEAQSRENGRALTALAAKVDTALAAPAPVIDYAKLALALIQAAKS